MKYARTLDPQLKPLTGRKIEKRLYNERMTQVEHGSFKPLAMPATGKFGRESSKLYLRLPEVISKKRETKYCYMDKMKKIISAVMKSIAMWISFLNYYAIMSLYIVS